MCRNIRRRRSEDKHCIVWGSKINGKKVLYTWCSAARIGAECAGMPILDGNEWIATKPTRMLVLQHRPILLPTPYAPTTAWHSPLEYRTDRLRSRPMTGVTSKYLNSSKTPLSSNGFLDLIWSQASFSFPCGSFPTSPLTAISEVFAKVAGTCPSLACGAIVCGRDNNVNKETKAWEWQLLT